MDVDPYLAKRIYFGQIEALFERVNVSVSGAAIAAVTIAIFVYYQGASDLRTCALWASFISGCALAHICLCLIYRRPQSSGVPGRTWLIWFTGISLAEGLGWGWGSVWLTATGHAEVTAFVIMTLSGVCSGASAVFSPYLPAFAVLFVPATSAAFIGFLTSDDPVLLAASPLILIFTAVIGPMGVKTNREFKQLIGLRVRAEGLAEDLRAQKEVVERASLAKSTFLAAASHDLRQPVHALSLFAGALRQVPMPAEGQRLLAQIEASTQAMDGLFSALLDISRLDAGVVEVHRSSFPIGPMIERICRDYVEEARAKGLRLSARPSALGVESDFVLVERILRNFVSNAVRYTSSGRVLIGARRRGPRVWIEVWDTGVGVPEALQSQIFEEYFQIENPERDRDKGLGLGLAIVRRLAKLLNCSVSVRSRPGRGSCFAISLPWEPAGAEASLVERAPISIAKGLVVVIDDEAAILQAMGSLLAGWGYEVIVAASGDETLERLARCPMKPDLIICDYRLRGGENGIDVITRVRADYNDPIAAMLITGDTAPDRLAEANATGLTLLHKPVANAKLRAAIAQTMAATRSDAEAEKTAAFVR